MAPKGNDRWFNGAHSDSATFGGVVGHVADWSRFAASPEISLRRNAVRGVTWRKFRPG
jgi:hypothetical protein